jgi:hypothetical protein
MPSPFTSITDIDPRPRLEVSSLRFVPPPPVPLVPSPFQLVGHSVTLGQPGNPPNSYGVLTISSVTLQSDGSYAFEGWYQTSLYNLITTRDGPPGVPVTGTFGPPQYGAYFLTATCTVHFHGSGYGLRRTVGGLMDAQDVVDYSSGTVSLSQSQASMSGQLFDCLEDKDGQPIFGCRAVTAAGTFM